MTKLKFFTITEFEKEQKYLSEQHKRGWKLTHITLPGFYHFEQCASENVVYQLDYNPDRHKNFRQYIQMFEELERVFKGRMIPLFIIFGLVLLPNLIANIYFIYIYKQPYFIGILFILGCACILYLTIIIKWIRMYKRLQKR